MTDTVPRRRLALIETIIAAARGARAAGGIAARSWFGAYFRGVDEEDLASREPGQLARAALAHLALGVRRRPGEPRISVFNPRLDTHGFDSAATCVTIVTDDMPFLVDSLGMAFAARGVALRMLVHPVLEARRDRGGRLRALRLAAQDGSTTAGTRRESWQLYEVERLYDEVAMRGLEDALHRSLADVRAAVGDWLPMRRRMRELAATLRARPPARTPAGETAEACHLLDWMEGGHFVFLGYRRYALRRGRGSDRLVPAARSGLGILRARPGGEPTPPALLRGPMREVARSPAPVVISKANALATVHRATYLDYVAVKEFDARGNPTHEHRFIGLWTATAYFASPHDIPLLRRKVDAVIAHFGLDASSHDGKSVMAVLETWPRDELFQSTAEELVTFARGVVNLYERRTTRLLARRDPFGRFWSCMVFVPRDRYTTDVRQRIERILMEALRGSNLESQVQISSSNHARVHVVVRTPPEAAPRLDVAEVERRIAQAATTWGDRLRAALSRAFDASEAARLAARYASAFPLAYQDEVEPMDALEDVADLEWLRGRGWRAATEPAPAARPAAVARAPEDREGRRPDRDLRPVADDGELRPARALRAPLADLAAGPAGGGLHPGLRVRAHRRRDAADRAHRGAFRPGLPRRLARRGRERRLQPAAAADRTRRAPDRRAARLLPLPAADRNPVQPGLHGAGPRGQRGARRRVAAAVRGAVRSRGAAARAAPPASRASRPRSSAASRQSAAPTRTASCAPSSPSCGRRCAPATSSATPAAGRPRRWR